MDPALLQCWATVYENGSSLKQNQVSWLGLFWIYSDDDLGQFRDGQKMTLTVVDNDTGQLGEPELLTGSKFGYTKGP